MLRHRNRAELLARAGNTDGDIETADGMAKGQKRRLKAKRKSDQRANEQLPKMAELEKEIVIRRSEHRLHQQEQSLVI